MSDNNETRSENVQSKPECCAALLVAREQLKLTVEQAAGRLNLPKERLIELESGRFSDTVSPAFYRGYVRTYCHLLNLDAANMVEQFSELFDEPTLLKSTPRLKPYTQKRREMNSRSSGFKWITLLIIIAILGLGSWGLKEKFFTSEPATAVPISGLIDEDEESINVIADQQTNNKQLLSSNSVALDPNLTQAAETPPDEANETTQADSDLDLVSDAASQTLIGNNTTTEEASRFESQDELTMAFVGDCWIDVRDANNERIAFGTKNNGRVITVTGVAPFSVTLGDPSVVRIQLNSNDVDLSGYQAGRPARLTVE